MSVSAELHYDDRRRSLRGTPVEFRIVYSVAFAIALLSGAIGHRSSAATVIAEARDAAWNMALYTIPQTPLG